MIFRLSQKLNAKIKAGTLKALLPDENPFADWSAHLFVADRMQYILLSNSALAQSESETYGKPREAFKSLLDNTESSESSPRP